MTYFNINKVLKLPEKENNWKIFLNIHQETNIFISEPGKNLELEKKNKFLKLSFNSCWITNFLVQPNLFTDLLKFLVIIKIYIVI